MALTISWGLYRKINQPCTVGYQVLLALWGAKSGIAKMGFWASLVIPRSKKTKVKKNFNHRSFWLLSTKHKGLGKKWLILGAFPPLTKTTITLARVDGFACLKFLWLPSFWDYHLNYIWLILRHFWISYWGKYGVKRPEKTGDMTLKLCNFFERGKWPVMDISHESLLKQLSNDVSYTCHIPVSPLQNCRWKKLYRFINNFLLNFTP